MKKLLTASILSVGLLFSSIVTVDASGTISSTQNPTVADGFQQLGNIQVVVDAGSLKQGDALVVRLPDFVSLTFENGIHPHFGGMQNRLVAPLTFNGQPNWNGKKAPFSISQPDQRRLVITSLLDQKVDQDFVFYLQFGSVHIDRRSYGAVNVNFEPSPGSGFPAGTASIGKVYGEETTFELSASGFKQNGDEMKFKLHIEEDDAVALTRNKELRVRLPQGFAWDGLNKELMIEGQAGDLRVKKNFSQEISIERLNATLNVPGKWEIPLQFIAVDPSKTKQGEINIDLQWDKLHQITIGSYEKMIKKEYVTFKVGSTTYLNNKNEKRMDVAPYIKNDRTYLPIRYVAESVGVRDRHIVWNDVARTVTFSAGKSAQLRVGSNIMVVDGEEIVMDTVTEIKDDRVMLPIRYISEAFGKKIDWDDKERTVTIEK
ncbi:hypothetical protein BEP19_13510 [Ammoniphilus oxalaticus]|uniref:Copper amine oxidase-like N-terminal domain-containing protein n=1 Tax=Ammoniphilus oxalaticus TaxID=66863 RepID=A0A419SFB8_9BACL|nr:copper amine oxidase N-terminal domain-containing protein [Ammoniphilus oxalaticus]RKD22082.1 hypothetical protein BEP19_13510 [Ammoniphilus oxalaticus]